MTDEQQSAPEPIAETPAPQAKPSAPTVTIDGRECPLGRLEYPDVLQLCTLAKQRQPTTLDLLKPHLDKLPIALQKAAIETAVLALGQPVLPGTPQFSGYVHSPDGLKEILAMSLRCGGDEVSREASDRFASTLGFVAGQQIIAFALGL